MPRVELFIGVNLKGEDALDEKHESHVEFATSKQARSLNVLLGDLGTRFGHTQHLIKVGRDPGVHGASHVCGLQDPGVVQPELGPLLEAANEDRERLVEDEGFLNNLPVFACKREAHEIGKMMLVHIGRFVLELIEVESGLIHQVSDLAPHDLVVVEGTPEDKGIFRVIY